MIVKKLGKFLLDREGRLRLLKTEKAQFGPGGKVVIMKDGKSLLLLTEAEWEQLITKGLAALKGMVFRRAQRFLYGFAFPGEIDRWGRVLIPPSLRK